MLGQNKKTKTRHTHKKKYQKIQKIMKKTNNAPPLEGVRVLELEGIGPAPLAAVVMADLGQTL